MNLLTSNPEFVRHWRAEMRAPRMLLSGGLSALICFLFAQAHSQSVTNRGYASSGPVGVDDSLYFWLMCVIAVALPLWCLSACLQAIANERQMKTYDFVRTTRMNSLELLFGYLFGAPLMAYYTIGIGAFIAFLSGLGEHVPIPGMLLAFLLLIVFSVFTSLLGLLISLVVDKPRAAGLLFVVLFFGWPMGALAFAASDSPFPGVSALAMIPGLLPFFHVPQTVAELAAPHVFGVAVPAVILSVLLYGSMAVWVALALVNNLKKEREEIRIFTNRQAIGFAVYVNVLLIGFFHPLQNRVSTQSYEAAFVIFLIFNCMLFYFTGVVTLTPQERLRSWYREFCAKRQSYLSDNALPWPWILLAGAIALVSFLFIVAMSGEYGQHDLTLGWAGFAILLLITFAVRDVLFLQWCMLTRMKNPVSKGIALIWLYYLAVVILGALNRNDFREGIPGPIAVLTPVGAFDIGKFHSYALFGFALQGAAIAILLFWIRDRLAVQPKAMAAAA